jgi:hypothetical protein
MGDIFMPYGLRDIRGYYRDGYMGQKYYKKK